jgi:hypothetical protein
VDTAGSDQHDKYTPHFRLGHSNMLLAKANFDPSDRFQTSGQIS